MTSLELSRPKRYERAHARVEGVRARQEYLDLCRALVDGKRHLLGVGW